MTKPHPVFPANIDLQNIIWFLEHIHDCARSSAKFFAEIESGSETAIIAAIDDNDGGEDYVCGAIHVVDDILRLCSWFKSLPVVEAAES
jgi:hypothetical protein